jgi:hypothetical protein
VCDAKKARFIRALKATEASLNGWMSSRSRWQRDTREYIWLCCAVSCCVVLPLTMLCSAKMNPVLEEAWHACLCRSASWTRLLLITWALRV